VFVRERLNGLYGPGPYVIAISIVSAPFLFICALVFSLIWCADLRCVALLSR